MRQVASRAVGDPADAPVQRKGRHAHASHRCAATDFATRISWPPWCHKRWLRIDPQPPSHQVLRPHTGVVHCALPRAQNRDLQRCWVCYALFAPAAKTTTNTTQLCDERFFPKAEEIKMMGESNWMWAKAKGVVDYMGMKKGDQVECDGLVDVDQANKENLEEMRKGLMGSRISIDECEQERQRMMNVIAMKGAILASIVGGSEMPECDPTKPVGTEEHKVCEHMSQRYSHMHGIVFDNSGQVNTPFLRDKMRFQHYGHPGTTPCTDLYVPRPPNRALGAALATVGSHRTRYQTTQRCPLVSALPAVALTVTCAQRRRSNASASGSWTPKLLVRGRQVRGRKLRETRGRCGTLCHFCRRGSPTRTGRRPSLQSSSSARCSTRTSAI